MLGRCHDAFRFGGLACPWRYVEQGLSSSDHDRAGDRHGQEAALLCILRRGSVSEVWPVQACEVLWPRVPACRLARAQRFVLKASCPGICTTSNVLDVSTLASIECTHGTFGYRPWTTLSAINECSRWRIRPQAMDVVDSRAVIENRCCAHEYFKPNACCCLLTRTHAKDHCSHTHKHARTFTTTRAHVHADAADANTRSTCQMQMSEP